MPARVQMLGVWDTVMALGSRLTASVNTSVLNRAFHVQETPAACVDHACQALAIDERRYDFRPEIWRASGFPGQTLKQRWFAGSHGNAGGSYGNDGLANCALHWIMDEAKALGLEVDEAFLKIYRPYPQDELSDPQTLFYKMIDKVRFKLGNGLRALDGYPASANLMLDPSVIQRFCSDPKEHPTMTERYRPKSVLSLASEHRSRWSEFLQNLGLDSETYPFPEDI